MSSRAGRAPRVVRGIAAAAVATFLATVSHASVGSQLPPASNVALALSLAAPVCVLLAGRALSWWRLSAAVVLSQASFHGILTLDLSGGVSTGGAHHGGAAVLWDAAAAHDVAAHASHSPWMWAAHALAAAVTVVALGRGEGAARLIARFVVAALSMIRPLRGLGPRTDALPATPAPLLLTTAMTVLSPMRHRGPPRVA